MRGGVKVHIRERATRGKKQGSCSLCTQHAPKSRNSSRWEGEDTNVAPTVIPCIARSSAVKSAAFYPARGCFVEVHRVLHNHRHFGFQFSIPDALLKEFYGKATSKGNTVNTLSLDHVSSSWCQQPR